MSEDKKKSHGKSWPSKDKLQEALDVFEEFREICRLQMELGYWVTLDFPSKHHINKILSIQYMDKETLYRNYGSGLIARAQSMIPYCKYYLSFIRDVEVKSG